MNKQCKLCGEIKNIKEFDYRKNRDIYESRCKVCRRKQQNISHQKPEYKEKHKVYLKKNPQYCGYAYVKKNRIRWSKLYNVSISAIAHHGLRIARQVFDKYNRKCNKCGSTERLSIHHIDGKGRHYQEFGFKPNNNLDNLELLCLKCHGMIHGKIGGKLRWSKKRLG